LPESRKLVFDDRHSLQLVLGSPGDAQRVANELQRLAGVELHVRGNEITLAADEPGKLDLAERLLQQMYGLARAGRPMSPADVGRALEVLTRGGSSSDLDTVYDDVVLPKRNGSRAIAPRSLTQKQYVDLMRHCQLTFGVGPAGTGKTFLAVAMAVRRLQDKQVRRIILTRPAIEAGENLGFLPGTLEEKVSPYMRPLHDALDDMIDIDKVARMVERGIIEVAPLAYMRGRTLNDAFVILDEAQNATREQMKMMLTRIGTGTWTVITGDPSQIDLPGGQKSGLAHAVSILEGIDGIGVVRFSDQDVMRHPLVQDIVRAYDKDDKARRARSTPRDSK
jgi:phosphate starvation-inducible PhoH-like protein